MSKVTKSVENHVATLTIDNPPVNALSKHITAQLLEHLNQIEQDDEIRVVIVTGAGEKAFVAGADIKEFPTLMEKSEVGAMMKFTNESQKMYNTLANLPKPTIAVIHGLALGGGCELALACDFRVASTKSQFGLPEIKLGLYPGGGGTQRLPRLIGTSKAKELMFLGDFISAEEAYRIGLVNLVTSEDELMEKAMKFANKLADRPGFTLKLIKQLVNRGTEVSLEEGLRMEADLFEYVFSSEDAREGVNAFIEKRKPQFKHR